MHPGRREFVESLGAAALVHWMPRATPAPGVARPTAEQLAWLDLEVGMFIHFAPNTWQDRENDDRSIPPEKLPFTADPVQWAETAVALGARYIVMVAKHVGGFCLWQTESSTYSIRQTPWRGGRGDVLADLSAACRERGLGLGVYLSPRDDHFGAGLAGRCATAAAQEIYNRAARMQLTELLTRYGPTVEVWFDGSSVVPVGDILAEHAANTMIFQGPHATIRWVGNEDGFAPVSVWNALAATDASTGIATASHGDPHGDAWLPLEVDVSIRRPDWFWNTQNGDKLLSLDQLLDIYYRSVGRGTQLLINLMPDRSGRIPETDVARAGSFGEEVRRRFGTPVAQARGKGPLVELPLRGESIVDHVVLEEDLVGGQRILAFHLEGLAPGGWRLLGSGTSVGHRRILPIDPGSYRAIRVVVSERLGTPLLRRMAAYRTASAPPPGWNQPASVWADDDIGRWRDGAFVVDLTQRITTVAQYRLRFLGSDGAQISLEDISFQVGGVGQPGLVKREKGRGDVLILTIPGLGQSLELRGRVPRGRSGTILLRRL